MLVATRPSLPGAASAARAHAHRAAASPSSAPPASSPRALAARRQLMARCTAHARASQRNSAATRWSLPLQPALPCSDAPSGCALLATPWLPAPDKLGLRAGAGAIKIALSGRAARTARDPRLEQVRSSATSGDSGGARLRGPLGTPAVVVLLARFRRDSTRSCGADSCRVAAAGAAGGSGSGRRRPGPWVGAPDLGSLDVPTARRSRAAGVSTRAALPARPCRNRTAIAVCSSVLQSI